MRKCLLLISVLTLFSANVWADDTPTSGSCGTSCTWRFAGNTLHIDGKGDMDNYTYISAGSSSAPWDSYKDSITNIVVSDGITSVGNYVCYQCTKVTNVSVPNTVTKIGVLAFYNNNLTSFEIPNSITTIKQSTFAGNQLDSIVIPNSVTSIELWAFASNNLTSVNIPDSVTSIGQGAFQYNQLNMVNIPDSVISIGREAFQYNQLTSIEIPDSVISIGDNAFRENPYLKTVYCTATEGKSKTTCENYAWPSGTEIIYYTKDKNTGKYTIDGKQYASLSEFEKYLRGEPIFRMRYTVQEANSFTSPKDINKFQVKFR